MITAGRVRIPQIPTPKASTLIGPGTPIDLAVTETFVSRGGEKLHGALQVFEVVVEGRRALDVGASTGGFTDCLLQAGAATVTAVDVGHGLLDWSLRTDERVVVRERTNIRYCHADELGGPFDVVVADLAFISLCTVADALARLASTNADLILLVKPQFEVGRDGVGKGGVVRDPEQHRLALVKVVDCLEARGLGTRGIVPSPLRGAKGNREFFVWARKEPVGVTERDIRRAVESRESGT